MSGGLFPRLHTWVANESLVYSDLNAEYDNIISHLQPIYIDNYSHSTSEMQITKDPGTVGSENLATDLADEIAELRFAIKRLGGSSLAQWYSAPKTDLTQVATLLGIGQTLPSGYISSGAVSTSDQPLFLQANGANATVKILGTSTNLVYSVSGILHTLSADLVSSTLSLAPSTGNTGTLTADLLGDDSSFGITTPGSAIVAQVGNFVTVKIGSEYIFGLLTNSGLTMQSVWRGSFFDSTLSPIAVAGHVATATVTLMKTAFLFISSSQALIVTYNTPTFGTTAPASGSAGDFFFNLSNGFWSTYNGSAWVSANAIFLGIAIVDATNCVATISTDFLKSFSDFIKMSFFVYSNTEIRTTRPGFGVSVYGNLFTGSVGYLAWVGSGLSAGTIYYLYVSDIGTPVIDTATPIDRTFDLRGWYHPSKPYRCVGWSITDGSSHFVKVSTDFINYTDTSSNALSGSTSGTTELSAGTFIAMSYGRPLLVRMGSNGGTLRLVCSSGSSSQAFILRLYRDGNQIAVWEWNNFGAVNSTFRYVIDFNYIDYGAAPGMHLYKFSLQVDDAANSMILANGFGQVATLGGP